MNFADIAIIAVIAALTVFCIYRLVKKGGGCGGNCSACGKNCNVKKKDDDEI